MVELITTPISNTLAPAADFIRANWPMLTMGFFIFLQWVALQALVVHYYMFRKSMRKPAPELKTIRHLERVAAFQEEQLASIYEKLAELRKDTNELFKKDMAPNSNSSDLKSSSDSLESNFLTLGEINLKKRIEALKSNLRQN